MSESTGKRHPDYKCDEDVDGIRNSWSAWQGDSSITITKSVFRDGRWTTVLRIKLKSWDDYQKDR
jgi:hypothetical protein